MHRRSVAALKVRQWLERWDLVDFDDEARRRKPQGWFLLFSLSAPELRALSGINRRSTRGGKLRTDDLGIQRRHDPERSAEIREFVNFGFPWSDLPKAKRELIQYADLRKPGWLPTAIIANILLPTDERGGKTVDPRDLVEVEESAGGASILLPKQFSGAKWTPEDLAPIEIIDGQHRLWAFDEHKEIDGRFELPVVAFVGLDISWQAYLFWTINIKPKRINASLAFDLYPLLRLEDCLEKFEGAAIYRETRAQELVEALWSYPKSPWFHRINMLGEPGIKQVSQAAWIRALLATFVKSWESRKGLGGLFGAPVGKDEQVLPWTRAQQAAVLMAGWSSLVEHVKNQQDGWANALRPKKSLADLSDPAITGNLSHLNTDQGVRSFLAVLNDLLYVRADQLGLSEWIVESAGPATDQESITESLESMRKTPIPRFLDDAGKSLSQFDWRTSGAPGITDAQRTQKMGFRGGGGYRELRRQLLLHLINEDSKPDVAAAAADIKAKLGY